MRLIRTRVFGTCLPCQANKRVVVLHGDGLYNAFFLWTLWAFVKPHTPGACLSPFIIMGVCMKHSIWAIIRQVGGAKKRTLTRSPGRTSSPPTTTSTRSVPTLSSDTLLYFGRLSFQTIAYLLYFTTGSLIIRLLHGTIIPCIPCILGNFPFHSSGNNGISQERKV